MKCPLFIAAALLFSTSQADVVPSGFGVYLDNGITNPAECAFTSGGVRLKQMTGTDTVGLRLTEDGKIITAQDIGGSGQPVIVPPDRKYIQICGSSGTGAAIDEFGHLHVWWSTFQTDANSYIEVEGSFVDVAATRNQFVIALGSDGNLDFFGRPGLADQAKDCVDIPVGNFVQVESYSSSSPCSGFSSWFSALDSEGRIVCFGNDPNNEGRFEGVPAGPGFSRISLTNRGGYAIDSSKNIRRWGGNGSATFPGPFKEVQAISYSGGGSDFSAIYENGTARFAGGGVEDLGYPIVSLSDPLGITTFGGGGYAIVDKQPSTLFATPESSLDVLEVAEVHDIIQLSGGF